MRPPPPPSPAGGGGSWSPPLRSGGGPGWGRTPALSLDRVDLGQNLIGFDLLRVRLHDRIDQLLHLGAIGERNRSEEHTSELQSHLNLVCRLLLEKKKKNI